MRQTDPAPSRLIGWGGARRSAARPFGSDERKRDAGTRASTPVFPTQQGSWLTEPGAFAPGPAGGDGAPLQAMSRRSGPLDHLLVKRRLVTPLAGAAASESVASMGHNDEIRNRLLVGHVRVAGTATGTGRVIPAASGAKGAAHGRRRSRDRWTCRLGRPRRTRQEGRP